MVVLSESYLQNYEKNAIELALRFDIAPKTFCRYVDDSHARFGSRNNANEFLNVLNSQEPQIQYTIEYENEHKELNFLDVTIKNNLNQSYDFAVLFFSTYSLQVYVLQSTLYSLSIIITKYTVF